MTLNISASSRIIAMRRKIVISPRAEANDLFADT
jgi:hypothetical protein